MKLTLLDTLLATLTVSTSASAGDLSLTSKYDFDTLSHAKVQENIGRGIVGLKYDFNNYYGAIDGGLAVESNHFAGSAQTGVGYDVGYSNGFTFSNVRVDGRIGFTRYNFSSVDSTRESEKLARYSVAASMPVTTLASIPVAGFVGVERQHMKLSDGVVSDTSNRMRYTIGGEFAITPRLNLDAGYARTMLTEGGHTNGFTTAASYKF